MGSPTFCDQCGAPLGEGQTCQDDFHQMLIWESDRPEYWQVHHLMVLCYHLQHPNLYSAEGLAGAKKLLVEFLENGVSPEDIRQREGRKLDSGNRKWRIKGSASSHGAYLHPVIWTMTVREVVLGGKQRYIENVFKWASSVRQSIQDSDNTDPATGLG